MIALIGIEDRLGFVLPLKFGQRIVTDRKAL
jgi:hypothetical protein